MHRLILLFVTFATFASAQDTQVLTIDRPADAVEPITFTLEALDRMTQVEIKASNEFVDGMTTFTGPLARVVLAGVGMTREDQVRFVAINEYEVMIAATDLFEYDVILATRANNQVLSRRDKGPIWLIYPTSDHPELQDARINSKLIWQVTKIEVQ